MTPIINPWIFYLAHVLNVIQGFGVGALLISIALFVIFGVGMLDKDPIGVKYFKNSLLGLIISIIILIFVPGEKTIMKMLITQNVTVERVEIAATTVQDVYEDIMGLFESDKED